MTRIAAPRPAPPPAPFRFPVVASIAPLAVAVVLWLVTNSPYSLLFALLGPVTAVASLADARVGSRRVARRERARFAAEAHAARQAIDAAHSEERASLAERTPSALQILARSGADPWRWSSTGGVVPLAIGTGSVPSSLTIDGEADAELARRAGHLSHAPVVVDAALGIGIVGPDALVQSVARSVVIELAWSLSPAEISCAGREPWIDSLPHAVARPLRSGVVAEFGVRGERSPLVTVATAATEADLPGECRVVLGITSEGAALVQHPDRSRRGAVRPWAISAVAAGAWAVGLAEVARREGIVASSASIPEVVPLAGLLGTESTAGLLCAIGVDSHGPVNLDLVADGPHAVIGGATGSGKSELLVSWVVGMAAVASPERLTVLLVDFKGGAAFAPLALLPHTVGIITDLDEQRASRALASLRAELRYRERMLADAEARDIHELPTLPRLVIVVDEFARVLDDHPDLHALFADIAARGRSLGVHLVLCTQRPAGVVRDAVLANADLRLSLRVNNRADSVSVVGTDAAANLPARAKGRGILAPADGDARVVQFALTSEADVQTVAQRWAHTPLPRRPWCEPLPELVTDEDAPDGFGILDLPGEQRRGMARWSPALDVHVLVLGAARSGVSTALAAIAPSALRIPTGVAAAWDLLHGELSGVLAIDDADSLLARLPAEYRAQLVERLAALLRDGPGQGIHLVLGARRVTADLQSLAALIPSRLMLRHASKQDWVLAGGESAEFVAGGPPGRGVWQGHPVQVVNAPTTEVDAVVARVGVLAIGRPLAIVTTRARHLLQILPRARPLADADTATLGPHDVVVGDVEEWQSRWGSLTAARQVAEVVFDSCSLADVRALTRARDLPPPLTGLRGVAWLLESDGRTTRVRFPPDRAGAS